jgi:hypothetical protein
MGRGFAGLHRAIESADHTLGQRAREAKRIANGQYRLAHLQSGGIAERQRRNRLVLGIDLEQCNVVARIGAHQFGGVARAVAERHLDVLRTLDDMVVGQHIAASVDHESRTRSFHRHRIFKKVVLHRLRDDVGHRWRRLAIDSDGPRLLLGQTDGTRRVFRRGDRLHLCQFPRAPACTGPIGRRRNQRAQDDPASRSGDGALARRSHRCPSCLHAVDKTRFIGIRPPFYNRRGTTCHCPSALDRRS